LTQFFIQYCQNQLLKSFSKCRIVYCLMILKWSLLVTILVNPKLNMRRTCSHIHSYSHTHTFASHESLSSFDCGHKKHCLPVVNCHFAKCCLDFFLYNFYFIFKFDLYFFILILTAVHYVVWRCLTVKLTFELKLPNL